MTAGQRLAFAFWMATAGMLTLRLVEVFPGAFLGERLTRYMGAGPYVSDYTSFWQWRYYDPFVASSAAVSAYLLARFPPESWRLGGWSGPVRGTLVAFCCHIGSAIGGFLKQLIEHLSKNPEQAVFPSFSVIVFAIALVIPALLLGAFISLFLVGGVTVPCMALASAAFDRLKGRR
jgi:hypothetical protein